jgi:hypothetical protein
MRAKPGRELLCRAHNHLFHEGGKTINQGVLSYFASRSLADSRTMGAWLNAITTALGENHDVPSWARPELQLQGATYTPLP